MVGNYLYWQFVQSPRKIIYIGQKTIVYLYHQFSIGFLLKTLIEPWKKDVVRIVNPSIQDRIQVLMTNIVSRLLGFMIRILTVLSGFLIMICVLVIFVLAFFFWLIVPFFAIYIIYRGVLIL